MPGCQVIGIPLTRCWVSSNWDWFPLTRPAAGCQVICGVLRPPCSTCICMGVKWYAVYFARPVQLTYAWVSSDTWCTSPALFCSCKTPCPLFFAHAKPHVRSFLLMQKPMPALFCRLIPLLTPPGRFLRRYGGGG